MILKMFYFVRLVFHFYGACLFAFVANILIYSCGDSFFQVHYTAPDITSDRFNKKTEVKRDMFHFKSNCEPRKCQKRNCEQKDEVSSGRGHNNNIVGKYMVIAITEKKINANFCFVSSQIVFFPSVRCVFPRK